MVHIFDNCSILYSLSLYTSLVQLTTSSRRLDGGAYCGAPVGGKWMASNVIWALLEEPGGRARSVQIVDCCVHTSTDWCSCNTESRLAVQCRVTEIFQFRLHNNCQAGPHWHTWNEPQFVGEAVSNSMFAIDSTTTSEILETSRYKTCLCFHCITLILPDSSQSQIWNLFPESSRRACCERACIAWLSWVCFNDNVAR